MATPKSVSTEDIPVDNTPSGIVNLLAMDLEAAQSLEASNTSVEEEEIGEEEHHDASKQRELEMGALIPLDGEAVRACDSYTHGDEKQSSKCDEPRGVRELEIVAKPSLRQDGFCTATGPATTSLSSCAVDVMESHKVEVLRDLEPMPTSTWGSLPNNREALMRAPFRMSKMDSDNMTCPDMTRVSQRRPQSGPGAYAVQAFPSFVQNSTTASGVIPGVGVEESKEADSPILHPSTNSISNLGCMDDFEFSNSSEPCLVEANPVLNVAEDVTRVAASPVDLNKVQERQLQWARQDKLCGLAFFLLILTIAVGSLVGTHLTKAREEMATQAPTANISMEPSDAPSSAPPGVLDLLFLDLPLHTQDSIFDGNTPQHQAYEWLSKHQNITNLPHWRRKQLFALATFFFAFEGEHWNWLIQERWMDDTMEECLWFSSGFGRFEGTEFVEWSLEVDGYPQTDSCNSQGEFIVLLLADLHLTGFAPSVPQEIALLTSLSYIGLFDNGIEVPFEAMLPPTKSSGLILSELGGLASLLYFGLSKNFISGSIPSEVGLLSETRVLYLEMNALSGTICSELGYMTSLEEVTLNDNSFTGIIPSELGQLTNLKVLWLRNLPLLTGSIPSELSLLTSLRSLDLRNSTGLFGIIPDELCFLQNASCNAVDYWGATYNCSLEFDCTGRLCGCDCPCSN
jgi:hypothetical protein